MTDDMTTAHRAGEISYRGARKFGWTQSACENPYEKRRGFDNEAWAWDLGWRLAEHLAKGGGR